MSRLLKTILSELASLATVIGLIYTLAPNKFTTIQWSLIAATCVLFVFVIYLTWTEFNSEKPKVFSEKKDIRDYMFNWISRSGRVAVFTRDLSWVEDDEMRQMLRNKAQKKELIICLPEKIEKVKEFEDNGALVVDYAHFKYVPKSRFTIINFGRDDSKVAVGKTLNDGKHSIAVYSNGEHPYFQVANDLICILERIPR